MENKPLFSLGQVVQTRGLYSKTENNPDRHNEVVEAFNKYVGGTGAILAKKTQSLITKL